MKLQLSNLFTELRGSLDLVVLNYFLKNKNHFKEIASQIQETNRFRKNCRLNLRPNYEKNIFRFRLSFGY
jgi:hypothetical protein